MLAIVERIATLFFAAALVMIYSHPVLGQQSGSPPQNKVSQFAEGFQPIRQIRAARALNAGGTATNYAPAT
jgi:hypothetical protein